jgi:hypothetical protein
MSQPSYVDPAQSHTAGYGRARSTNTVAILSLVFAFVFAPLGIVFGHVARNQIRRTGEQGSGLATAGLWLGYIEPPDPSDAEGCPTGAGGSIRRERGVRAGG